MSDHISKQFDSELENIRTRVLQMGGYVEQQVTQAMHGLLNGKLDVLDLVIENDHQVNRFETELDELCSQVIARRQPTASDLRLVLTVSKTITDLERVGDEAKKIAKLGKQFLGASVPGIPQVELKHMANQAVDMLRNALDAFARMNVNVAGETVRKDKEVDQEFKAIMRQLVTYMMEDPRMISRSIDILFIAKAIERVGDHAKNIAEFVVYMVEGRDIRHASLDEIERGA